MSASAGATVAEIGRRTDFGDVEYAIPSFDGDDRSFDVRDFVRMFEEIMTIIRADEVFKLLVLRRKLKGAANCLTFAPDAVTYDGLKAMLIAEFGNKLSIAEAERMLRRRKWMT